MAACSLVTSFNGLEASGDDPETGGGADSGGLIDDRALPDSGTMDGETMDSSTVDGSEVDSRTVDATAPDADALGDSATRDEPTSTVDSAGCTADASADPANCGACGHDCLGGACNQGVCGSVTLAVTHGAVGLAVDSTFAYWADSDAGAINKVSKSLTHEGTPSPVVTGSQAQNVQGIATDGTYIYWTVKVAAGSVYRALPTGTGVTLLASNQSQPDWIATNGTTVAWTNQKGNQVMAAPVSGNGTVVPTQLNAIGENGSIPAGIAIDGASVYYVTKTTGGGLAESAPLGDGGAVTELGTGTYVSVAADSNNVYWTGGASNPNVYQNKKGGTPTTEKTIAAGALTCPLGVASDGTNVYFLDQGTSTCGALGTDAGALYRVPVGHSGSLPPPLLTGFDNPQGMTMDSTAVYWVTGGPTGALMKMAK
jgi:hypothetical protein